MSKLSLDFNGTYPFAPFVKSVEYVSASLTATGVNLVGVYVGSGQTAYGFEYCTDKEGSKTDVAGTKTEGETKFTGSVTGLHSETLYYMRGYLVVDEVKTYGQWYEITTEENNIVIVNSAASEIAQTTATIGAEFTSNAANISAAKMQYCTDVEGTITDVDITPIASPISTPLTELAAGTKYYYRLKLTCEEEDVVSEWDEFTTEANNIVVGVQAASSITATGAALSAAYTSNSANISAAKLQYCTDVEGVITDVDITPVTSPLTATLTELTAATTYYFRCKLTCENVDTLGEWIEFTTLTE